MKQYSFLQEVKVNIDSPESVSSLKKAFKIGKIASSALFGTLSLIKMVVSYRITSLIKMLQNVQDRNEAEQILLNIGYVTDGRGLKKMTVGRINYALSKAVVGPALQIVKNETDPEWHSHLIHHLRLCRKSNFIVGLVGGIMSSTNIFSMIG